MDTVVYYSSFPFTEATWVICISYMGIYHTDLLLAYWESPTKPTKSQLRKLRKEFRKQECL